MIKSRYLEPVLTSACFGAGKMAFISGPRQSGKTTMAKHLLRARKVGAYYNWDEIKFRRLWVKDPSQILSIDHVKAIRPLIILDEIHKAKLWKRNIKGVYDTMEPFADIVVTGSARLNVYRKGSDSLLGRYYHFRLHPFSLAELMQRSEPMDPEAMVDRLFAGSIAITRKTADNFTRLFAFGPFPDPFLSLDKKQLTLWQRNRMERIIREDLRDLSRLPELSQVEMLATLLPERVAQPLSISSLSEDLEVTYPTIKRWLQYLSELYYIYLLMPYNKSLTRSIKKEKKLYLWDWSEVSDPGSRFENMIAGHLLKYCHYLIDTGVGKFELYYLKNRDKKEIDFLIVYNNKPLLPIEVKLSQDTPSDNWRIFLGQLKCPRAVQIVKVSGVYKRYYHNDVEILIVSADQFLSLLV